MMKLFQQVRAKLHPGRMYFQYSGFYDFPLGLIATHLGRTYLLERTFDEELDEYEDFFRVYDITEIFPREGDQIWKRLHDLSGKLLCTIPINQLSFDESRRKWITVEAFQKFENASIHAK